MAQINIFECATKNSKKIIEEFNTLLDNSSNCKDFDEKYCDEIKQKWTLSINMRPSILNNFFKNQEHLNKNEQGMGLKNKRRIFESYFVDGQKFRYSAFNIKGLGLSKYGIFCVLLDREKVDKLKQLVFIKNNIFSYIENNKFKIDLLKKKISDRTTILEFLILKYSNKIEGIELERICYNGDYIESITTDRILISFINKIRISDKEYKRILSNIIKKYDNSLRKTEKLEFLLLNKLKKKKILEVIK